MLVSSYGVVLCRAELCGAVTCDVVKRGVLWYVPVSYGCLWCGALWCDIEAMVVWRMCSRSKKLRVSCVAGSQLMGHTHQRCHCVCVCVWCVTADIRGRVCGGGCDGGEVWQCAFGPRVHPQQPGA